MHKLTLTNGGRLALNVITLDIIRDVNCTKGGDSKGHTPNGMVIIILFGVTVHIHWNLGL